MNETKSLFSEFPDLKGDTRSRSHWELPLDSELASRQSKSDHVTLILKTLQSLLTDLGIKSEPLLCCLAEPIAPSLLLISISLAGPETCRTPFASGALAVAGPCSRILLVGSWPLFRTHFKWHPNRTAFLDGPLISSSILPPLLRFCTVPITSSDFSCALVFRFLLPEGKLHETRDLVSFLLWPQDLRQCLASGSLL